MQLGSYDELIFQGLISEGSSALIARPDGKFYECHEIQFVPATGVAASAITVTIYDQVTDSASEVCLQNAYPIKFATKGSTKNITVRATNFTDEIDFVAILRSRTTINR